VGEELLAEKLDETIKPDREYPEDVGLAPRHPRTDAVEEAFKFVHSTERQSEMQ
jgi:hypothetical protein